MSKAWLRLKNNPNYRLSVLFCQSYQTISNSIIIAGILIAKNILLYYDLSLLFDFPIGYYNVE